MVIIKKAKSIMVGSNKLHFFRILKFQNKFLKLDFDKNVHFYLTIKQYYEKALF